MGEKLQRGEIKFHLRMLDEAFDKKAWHGPNLRAAVRGVTARQAAWRPTPRRHNIWEIVLHVAYWKSVVWQRLGGDKRRPFPYKGKDWFVCPGLGALSEKVWRKDLALLEQTHRQLRQAVAGLPEAALYKAAAGSKASNSNLICGIAGHDIYHAGQIRLLRRLERRG